MEDKCAIYLLGVMDRLWFQQIILLPEPTSQLLPKTFKAVPEPILETPTCLSSNMSHLSLLEDEISSPPSASTLSEDDCNNQDDDYEENEIKSQESTPPTSLINYPITSKSWSHSSSKLNNIQIHPKKRLIKSYSRAVVRLQKTMSCKSLSELELEEVKGFMDLGFKFSKKHISPKMVSVLPGLQRLGRDLNEEKNGGGVVKNGDYNKHEHEVIDEEEEEERGVMRPYLSEAWAVNRPDLPLLNLRLPRVSAADDMKKHLRYWAKTVASVIRQES